MRISDWSSDVCSSDLRGYRRLPRRRGTALVGWGDAAMTQAKRPGGEISHEVARQLLRAGAVHVSRQQPFVLAAGWASPVYVDVRRLLGEPELRRAVINLRSEEHTSELQSLMRISYAVF